MKAIMSVHWVKLTAHWQLCGFSLRTSVIRRVALVSTGRARTATIGSRKRPAPPHRVFGSARSLGGCSSSAVAATSLSTTTAPAPPRCRMATRQCRRRRPAAPGPSCPSLVLVTSRQLAQGGLEVGLGDVDEGPHARLGGGPVAQPDRLEHVAVRFDGALVAARELGR